MGGGLRLRAAPADVSPGNEIAGSQGAWSQPAAAAQHSVAAAWRQAASATERGAHWAAHLHRSPLAPQTPPASQTGGQAGGGVARGAGSNANRGTSGPTHHGVLRLMSPMPNLASCCTGPRLPRSALRRCPVTVRPGQGFKRCDLREMGERGGDQAFVASPAAHCHRSTAGQHRRDAHHRAHTSNPLPLPTLHLPQGPPRLIPVAPSLQPGLTDHLGSPSLEALQHEARAG